MKESLSTRWAKLGVAMTCGALLALTLYLGQAAYAKPNCDVPHPPPVCDGDEPSPPPQPPRNDNWANAINLGSVAYEKEVVISGNSNLATMESGEPRPQDPTKDCGIFGVSNSVWYKVAPAYELAFGKSVLHLSTEGSSFDTTVALYEEGPSLTSLRQVACSNSNSGPNWTDRLTATVNAGHGEAYYIQLLGTGGDRSGDFRLKASLCIPPFCAP